MTAAWFKALRALVLEATGVTITADNQYLAESRLMPLLKGFNLPNLNALVEAAAAAGRTPEISTAVVDAMMTGETFFFRDTAQFKQIRERVLPALVIRNQDKQSLRIWSAACSSGQEPYSLAMILDEMAPHLRGWRVDLVASDVCQRALDQAIAGNYNQFEVQRGLPVANLLNYFEHHNGIWRINAAMRAAVDYRIGNVINAGRSDEPYDLILCRNVLMYFDTQTRRQALDNINRRLSNGGFLIIGASEANIAQGRGYHNVPGFPAILQKRSAQADSSDSAADGSTREAI